MKAKNSKATLCEVSGHDWQKTSSDKVQVCSRSNCKQIKQLVRGHWQYPAKVVVKGGLARVKDEAVSIATLWGDV